LSESFQFEQHEKMRGKWHGPHRIAALWPAAGRRARHWAASTAQPMLQ
jgi:hypothetical protein